MAKDDIINKLTSIKGLGKAKAESIYDSGLNSVEKLNKAKIEDLTKISGITDEIAKNIKDEFKTVKTESKEVKKDESSDKKTDKKKVVEQSKKKDTEKTKEEKPVKKIDKVESEEKEYVVKKKPELSADIKKTLDKRKEIKKRTPNFLREEWFRYKRIPRNWRRPDGITSKMRINLKYRPSRVRVGFRGPKETRDLHPSGFKEIMVYNVKDLEAIDPKTQAARIGGTVGYRKRLDIEKKAEELEIRVLNI